jgi:hypothetical protein
MNDIAKFLAAAAGGAVAMHLYRNYQAEQQHAAQQAAYARRGPVQRIADTATGVIQDLVPASQMQGMNGHMAMPPQRAHGQRYAPQGPAAGFYAQGGMRQSAPGNPHAPVIVPGRRVAAQRSAAPPPPPPPPSAAEANESGYESYGDGNVMGGQSF